MGEGGQTDLHDVRWRQSVARGEEEEEEE